MDTFEKQERKREAWRRLRAQRERAGRLRGRVVAISLIGFALLWGVVFAQMATGNDPVLGPKEKAAAATASVERRGHAKAAKRQHRRAAEVEASANEVEAGQAASEGVESTEAESTDAEVESELAEIEAADEAAEAEAAEAEFTEVEAEPEFEEVEPEPLVTSQS